MNKQIWITIGLIASLSSVAAVAGTRSQAGTPSGTPTDERILDSAVVGPADITVTVTDTGNVKPLREADLSFGTVDTVTAVNVDEQDKVHAGDVLATLDTAQLDLAIQAAEVAVHQQQSRLQNLIAPGRAIDIQVAQAAVNAASARLQAVYANAPSAEDIQAAKLQTDLARNLVWQSQLQRDMTDDYQPEFRETNTNNPTSQDALLNGQIDQAQTGVSIAQEQYQDVAQQGPNLNALGSAQAAIVSAEKQLDDIKGDANPRQLTMAGIAVQNASLAVDDLRRSADDRRIVAPFDGIVTIKNLNVGELPPTGAAFVLADTSQYTVEVDMDETNVGNLRANEPVAMTFDALPDVKATGKVIAVSVVDSAGSNVPTYRVKIALDPSDAPIRSGMTAKVTVTAAQLEQVLSIPARFVNDRGMSGSTVYVLNEANQIEEVPVVLGLSDGTTVQVTSGLQAGQQVVLPRSAS